jgi:type I restriction enzyme S subunit
MARAGFIQSLYRGIRERSSDFRFEVFASQFYPVPPRSEQDQIVRYLDWKVSQIIKLINAKRHEIELLKEQKQAIINQAVTRGLNPDVPMKDSGIAWIGAVPEHWKSQRGKVLYGKQNRDVQENDDVITCFRDGVVTLRKNRRTTGFTEAIEEIGYQGIRKGDLVIHVMDAFAGSIGVSDSDGKATPVYNVCSAKIKLDNRYYAYLLREMARTGYIQSLYRGIRQRSSDFRFDVFASQFYVLPPYVEQKEIADFLDKESNRISEIIVSTNNQIELLHEYRTRLISDVVTGKVDVRDVEVPEYETIEETADAENEDDEAISLEEAE